MSAGKVLYDATLNCFLRIYNKLVWGLFVLTDVPVVMLSWLGPAVKTGLQNVRGRLFPETCALWLLTPAPALRPPHWCCRGLCFRGMRMEQQGFSVSLPRHRLKERLWFFESVTWPKFALQEAHGCEHESCMLHAASPCVFMYNTAHVHGKCLFLIGWQDTTVYQNTSISNLY